MSCINTNSNINQTFIIEPASNAIPVISACTSVYTNNILSCSGDTQIFMGTGVITFNGNLYTNNDLSATTINASTYYSGGTNLFDIIDSSNITGGTFDNTTDTLTLSKVNGSTINVTGLTDYYTTGSTLIGTTIYFDRNDTLSAYTTDLSSLDVNDTFITGLTFNDNQLIIARNDGVNLDVFLNTFTGLTINGLVTSTSMSASTISADTIFLSGSNLHDIIVGLEQAVASGTTVVQNGVNTYTGGTTLFPSVNVVDSPIFTSVSATTLSATTFFGDGSNLTGISTQDTFVTGGTYSSGTAVFTNNTGGTFSVTGLYTGTTDVFVTGGTFNNTLDTLNLLNNTGGTFTITGFTDFYITGGTFTNNTKNLSYTRNDNIVIDVELPFRLLFNSSAATTNDLLTTIDTVTGITNNTNTFVVSYLTAFKDNIDYGFWKRTLALSKISNIVTIVGENVDFDRVSSGLTPTSVIFVSNSGDLDIKISGETSKNYTWSSNWEIIK